MKKRRNPVKRMIQECDDIAVILENHAEGEAEEAAERRYKIVVMTILPFLLVRTGLILFEFSACFGLLLFFALCRF